MTCQKFSPDRCVTCDFANSVLFAAASADATEAGSIEMTNAVGRAFCAAVVLSGAGALWAGAAHAEVTCVGSAAGCDRATTGSSHYKTGSDGDRLLRGILDPGRWAAGIERLGLPMSVVAGLGRTAPGNTVLADLHEPTLLNPFVAGQELRNGGGGADS